MDDLQAELKGVAVTTVTHFSRSGSIDHDLTATRASWLASRGIRVLIPSGNTGEFHSLTRTAWSDNLRAAIEGAGGEALVVPGVGGALPDAISMVGEAATAGAAGVMVLPVHHTFTSIEGARGYLRDVLDASEVGVIAYLRNPAHVEPVLACLDHPNLAGVKFAIPDVALFANTMDSVQSSATWSCGIAEQWAPFFALAGPTGFTSGIGNFLPELPLTLHRALQEGDWREAMRIRRAAVPFELLRARRSSANNVPAVKAAMDELGMQAGPVLPPLSPIPDNEMADLRDALAALTAAVASAVS